MYSNGVRNTPISSFVQGYESSWSPDGTKIAFAVSGYPPVGIAVVDADGSNGSIVFEIPGNDVQTPSLSPDGMKIVFSYLGHLEIINVDGSNPVNLTGVWGSGYKPDWSP